MARKRACPLGVPPEHACGYCRKHRSTVSVTQMKKRKCLEKECWYFVRYKQHSYWVEQQQKKEKRAARKAALRELYDTGNRRGNNEERLGADSGEGLYAGEIREDGE